MHFKTFGLNVIRENFYYTRKIVEKKLSTKKNHSERYYEKYIFRIDEIKTKATLKAQKCLPQECM